MVLRLPPLARGSASQPANHQVRPLAISSLSENNVEGWAGGRTHVSLWGAVGSDIVRSTDLAQALGGARRIDEIATIALEWLTELRGVVRAGFALPVVGGRQLRFLSSDGAPTAEPSQWCAIDAYDHLPLNDAIRTGRNVVLDNATEFAKR